MVWEITKAGVYKDLHDFGGTVTNASGTQGPDGQGPYGSISFDNSGNLYGTCTSGGPFADYAHEKYGGILWEITTKGTYRDLHDFGGTVKDSQGKSFPDGWWPSPSAVFDASGNIYGTTESGGIMSDISAPAGPGIVWERSSAGAYKILHDFNAQGEGYQPIAGVTLDAAGNLYGTTCYGGVSSGLYSGGTVWEITAGGVYSHLHDFYGSVATSSGKVVPDGTQIVGGVSFDASGNLYGTASEGGASLLTFDNGFGMVWVIAGGLKSLSVEKTSIYGGNPLNSTVTLARGAPTAGLTVGLSSNSNSATEPKSVFLAPGAASIQVLVDTFPVATPTTVTLNSILDMVAKSAKFIIDPPIPSAFAVAPTTVTGGSLSTATVKLSGPAPSGGFSVSISSNSGAATVPASVTV
jgi:hypothetical protein